MRQTTTHLQLNADQRQCFNLGPANILQFLLPSNEVDLHAPESWKCSQYTMRQVRTIFKKGERDIWCWGSHGVIDKSRFHGIIWWEKVSPSGNPTCFMASACIIMTSTLYRSNHRPPHVCIQHPSNVSLPIPIKFVLLAIPFSQNAIPHISLLLNPFYPHQPDSTYHWSCPWAKLMQWPLPLL